MKVLPAGVPCSSNLMSGKVVGNLGCHWGDNNSSSSPQKGLKQMVSKKVWNYDWVQQRQPQLFGHTFFVFVYLVEKENVLAVGGLELGKGHCFSSHTQAWTDLDDSILKTWWGKHWVPKQVWYNHWHLPLHTRIYSNLLFGWEILYSPRTYKRGSSSIWPENHTPYQL